MFINFCYNNIVGLTFEMTEIMEIIGLGQTKLFPISRDSQWNQQDQTIICQFCRTRNFATWFQNNCYFLLLDSSYFCRPQLNSLGLSGLVEISKSAYHIQFELTIRDSNGSLVRASSVHQKTGVGKLNNFSQVSHSKLSVACNPLTGEIKFTMAYFVEQAESMELILENILESIQCSSEQICKILEFLEIVPRNHNKLIIGLSAKMEKCRVHLLGAHYEETFSQDQELHEQMFVVKETELPIVYSWLDHTKIRIFAQETKQKQKQKLVENPQNVRKSNFILLELAQNSKTNTVSIENLMSVKSTGNSNQFFVQNYQLSNPENIDLAISFKSGKKSEEEIERVQKLSRTNYYKFIREYVSLKKQDHVNKKYILKKHEQLHSIKLFLYKNRTSVSYQTKLHVCLELASIGWICLTNIKKVQPSYSSLDVSVTEDYSLKLQRIMAANKNKIASLQIAQTCYQILYDVRAQLKSESGFNVNHKYGHNVKIIDDGESKYQGVSVINFWLKKILLDVIQYGHSHQPVSQSQQFESLRNFSSRQNLLNDFNRCFTLSSPTTLNSSASFQTNSFFNLGPSASSSTSLFSNNSTCTENMEITASIQQQIALLQKLIFVLALASKTYRQIYEKGQWDGVDIDAI